jgi:protein-S-isoprenylcysteine O-methyltransferase Ste14
MKERSTPGRALFFALRSTFLIPIQAVVLFLSAGSLNWTWGWVYTGIVYLSALIGMFIVGSSNRELAQAKLEFPEEQQPWDELLLRTNLPLMLAIFILAGLDWRRGWSGVTLGWRLAGIVGLLGITRPLATWAMAVNRHWSGTVHLQHDKGHQVCDVGPYAFVRHPAYLAGLFQLVWPALILGSWWALIPAVLISISIVVRTYLEDEFLRAELPGYSNYTRRVRYRLVPGVW